MLRSCLVRACLDRQWRDGQTLRQTLPATIGALRPALRDAYAELLAATDDAPLFVLGYPQVFPATQDEQDCFKLRPYRGEMDFLREMGELFDEVLTAAAADAGVHFVAVSEHFAGHEVCGQAGEWMQGPRLGKGSFHPNQRGQAAYAEPLNRRMAELTAAGAPTESTGVPANPGAAAAAAMAAADHEAGPRPTVGPLQVERVEERPAWACPQILRPGDEVRLVGEGFAPPAIEGLVSLHVESDGEVVDLGWTVPSDEGVIDAVVTVPEGFDPPPVDDPEDIWQPETVAGFEAAGFALDGSERLLVGVAGLSHTHLPCDVTPPTVDIDSPADGATYPAGETVVADYDCVDEPGGSGIAECVGDMPSGAEVNTGLPGTYRFTVTASDRHGNASQQTVTYTVDPPAEAKVCRLLPNGVLPPGLLCPAGNAVLGDAGLP